MHPLTAAARNGLALSLYHQGEFAQAEENYHQALILFRTALGEEHIETAQSYTDVATCVHAQGRYERAEVLLLSAADRFAKARLRLAATGLGRAARTSA